MEKTPLVGDQTSVNGQAWAELRRPAEGRSSSRSLVGPPRDFFNNRFVYLVISQRARGLSIGVNLNPDKACNFDCIYCEVDRQERAQDTQVDLKVMTGELRKMLILVTSGKVQDLADYRSIPAELLQLKEVALSGDGEPTLCPNFAEVAHAVFHLRSQGDFPFFKIVLISNSTGFHLPEVQAGLKFFTAQDEIWAKLDAGTQAYMDKINRPQHSILSCPQVSLEQVLGNILCLARQRPIVIQSLFPLLDGQEPPPEEIEAYAQRLRELKEAGARISLVQVYSAHRSACDPNCGHLPLRTLSRIAQRVREVSGLKAEVF